jgi:hypothetical protein
MELHTCSNSVAEPSHFDAALAPVPTLLHTKPFFFKQAKVRAIVSPDFFLIGINIKLHGKSKKLL